MDIHIDWTGLGVIVVVLCQLIGFIIWLTRLNSEIDFLKQMLKEMASTIHQLETVYSKKEEVVIMKYQIEGLGKRVDELKEFNKHS